MLIHLYKQATTTPKVRAAIQANDEPAAVLAARFGTNEQTAYKWRHRDIVHDRSHTPHHLQTTLSPAQEAVAVALCKTLLVSLDDLLAVVREFLNPDVSRSDLDRCPISLVDTINTRYDPSEQARRTLIILRRVRSLERDHLASSEWRCGKLEPSIRDGIWVKNQSLRQSPVECYWLGEYLFISLLPVCNQVATSCAFAIFILYLQQIQSKKSCKLENCCVIWKRNMSFSSRFFLNYRGSTTQHKYVD